MTESVLTRRRFLGVAGAGAALSTLGPWRGSAAAGKADVVVIGAGLSGLYAAMLLEQQGMQVQVLEGRDRIGGRLYTLDEVPGAPEAGGNGIGGTYARLLEVARRLQVKTQPLRERTEVGLDTTLLHVGGELIASEKWAESAHNPFPEKYRDRKPWQMLFNELRTLNPLKSLEAWQTAQYAEHDVSIASALARLGLDSRGINLVDVNASYGTNLYETSLLQLFHVFANFENALGVAGAGMAIAGGNQRIPEAMAESLKTQVKLTTSVAGVRHNEKGVEVVTRGGDRYQAEHVVVSVPFSAARLIGFDPVLPGLHAEAIATLPYHQAFQVHFAVEKPFWEQDGLPTSLWSDGPLERFNALYYGEDGSVSSFMHYANGDGANRFDRMPPDAAAQFVLAEYERVRPAAKGALRPVQVVSWQRDPFAGGAYASWRPGMITRFANEMRKPVGRVHFAGEHTSVLQRGMEGALESAERAALEILGLAS